MSIATELKAIAELLEKAAWSISIGVRGSFADEEDGHPMAKDMRAVERRCRKKAKELRLLARSAEKE